jgi:hypothetical protein
MTEVELGEELRQIYKRIGQPLSRDVVGLMDELDDRCQWLARSSELLAEAQAMNDRRRGKESEALTELPASLIRERLSGICADESRLLKLADRLNATIVHQIDAIRTILSFEKSLSQQTSGSRP